jgi:hypothetical protein
MTAVLLPALVEVTLAAALFVGSTANPIHAGAALGSFWRAAGADSTKARSGAAA